MWHAKHSLQLKVGIIAFSFLCVGITQSTPGISLYSPQPVAESGCSCTPETCACESKCCTTSVPPSTSQNEDTLTGVSCETTAFHMEMILLLTKGIAEPTLTLFTTSFTSSYMSSETLVTYLSPAYAIFHPPNSLS